MRTNRVPILLEAAIYFRDLKPEAQENILSIFNLKSEKEVRWDVVPLAVIDSRILLFKKDNVKEK